MQSQPTLRNTNMCRNYVASCLLFVLHKWRIRLQFKLVIFGRIYMHTIKPALPTQWVKQKHLSHLHDYIKWQLNLIPCWYDWEWALSKLYCTSHQFQMTNLAFFLMYNAQTWYKFPNHKKHEKGWRSNQMEAVRQQSNVFMLNCQHIFISTNLLTLLTFSPSV